MESSLNSGVISPVNSVMNSDIKPSIRIEYYKTLDKEIVRDNLRKLSLSLRNEFFFIVVASGDLDMSQFAIDNLQDPIDLLIPTFRGACYNKSMIYLVDVIYKRNPTPHLLLSKFLWSMDDYPETVILAKNVYDYLNLIIRFDKNFISNAPAQIRILFYEFLFQSGYYPYSFFIELYKTNPNPELKKWIDITDI